MKTYPIQLASLFAVAAVASGCASQPPADTSASGAYCYQPVTYRLKTCTTAPVPSLSVDAEAKRFERDPSALTIYVVRSNWADGPSFVSVKVDSGPSAQTLPNSMVRMKLSPGTHSIAYEFEGQRATQSVQGKAGDIRFLRIEGNALQWNPSFSWVTEPEMATRERALKARLVADIVMR